MGDICFFVALGLLVAGLILSIGTVGSVITLVYKPTFDAETLEKALTELERQGWKFIPPQKGKSDETQTDAYQG